METDVSLLSFPQQRYEGTMKHGKSEPASKSECDFFIGFARETKEASLICCWPVKSALLAEAD